MSIFKNNIAHTFSLNRTEWLSAKIYSDMKDGCSCGSTKWKMVKLRKLPEYEAPICAKCGEDPTLYLITASVTSPDGLKQRLKVRYTQEGRRLTDEYDVIFTLRNVLQEIENQTFDIKRYESKKSRESYKFSVFSAAYLKHHEDEKKKGELSPAGLRDKQQMIKNHLLPFFKDMDIAHITDLKIKEFFRSYTTKLRTRNKATAELKTILKFAISEKKLQVLPLFPELAPSKMITPDNFISREQQEKIISKITHPVYKAAIRVLQIYGLRPCDVRSFKWGDIDFKKKVFYIRSHVSSGEEISGRKSQADAVHELPIEAEFLEAIAPLPRSINPNELVFKGSHGGFIGENVLNRHWKNACKAARVKITKLYIGTKHSTLSRLGQKASDAQLVKLSGHSNTKTIRRYNQSTVDQVRELIQ